MSIQVLCFFYRNLAPFLGNISLHHTWHFDGICWQQNWASLLMPVTLNDVNFLGKIVTDMNSLVLPSVIRGS